jgi:CubicO group peptidase (beta-lactamase class C family)
MRKQQLDHIQGLLDEITGEGLTAGISCLIHQGGIEQGYYEAGYSDIENHTLFHRNAICHMFSMTKPITSAAVMMLLERGKLDLMDPVSKYYPSFADPKVAEGSGLRPASREVEIHDLLSMTSGYTYGGADDEGMIQTQHLTDEMNERLTSDDPMTTAEFADRIGRIPLSFDPGTDFKYSYSADILGAVVEKVSGMRYGDFLKENIFDPLKMKDTGFYVPEDKLSRLSQAYRSVDGKLVRLSEPNLGVQIHIDKEPAFEAGGAGIKSTIDDYMRFTRMLIGEGELDGVRVLEPGTIRFMRSAGLTDMQQKGFDRDHRLMQGYTYGNLMRVMVRPEIAQSFSVKGEFGWDGWLGTYMMVDPANSLTFVMMQQLVDGCAMGYIRKLRNIIYSAM